MPLESMLSGRSTGVAKIGFVSLGCPKALVDSERILTQLNIDGYQMVPDYETADLVIVNTCGFIDSAKAESLHAIGEALEHNGRVLVTGCMGADRDSILSVHPSVMDVSGPQQYEQVVGAVHEHLPIEHDHNPHLDLIPPQGIKLTPRHYAYLKISEGCNHGCTFCIIPDLRGKLVSRPIEQVLAEAHRLVRAGVRELLVVSQDTSAYGVDIKYQSGTFRDKSRQARFADLCDGLSETGAWVRLHYVYPYPHVDQVIPLMADGRILPYLDMPLQHGAPSVLKRMKRPAATAKVLDRITRWREQCPELVLRSTFIVGFPGETEAEFQQLLDFIEQARIDRAGCFTYSNVDGARANALPDQVDEAVKQDRYERFMVVQQRISREILASKVGTTVSVIIDQVSDDAVIGRSTADAPEIDGSVYLPVDAKVTAGQIVSVRIEHADDYDLWGEPVGTELPPVLRMSGN